MKLKIKDEYLDEVIFCPFTKTNVVLRFVNSDMYELYKNKGYAELFEEDKPKVIKKDKPTNFYDIPE